MWTLLIVEDEDIVRRGLVDTIEWESMGFKVIGEAESGECALKLFKEKRPDVVMTDIKLPGISGLELLKNISRISPDTEFVILSGYNDFEYAQKAIDLSVFSYILKLNIFNDIEKVFSDLNNKLLKKNRQKDELRRIRSLKNYEKVMSAVKGKTGSFDLSAGIYCVLIAYMPDETEILKKCEEEFLKQGLLFTTRNETSIILILQDKTLNSLKASVLKVERVLEKQETKSYLLAKGSEAFETDKISKSYEEAVKVLDYAVYMGIWGLIDISDIYDVLTNKHQNMDWAIMEKHIMLGQTEEISGLMDNLFRTSALSKHISVSDVKKACLKTLVMINDFIDRHDVKGATSQEADILVNLINETDYVFKVNEYFNEIFNLKSVAIRNISQGNRYELFEKIKEFVDNNYDKDLKMQDVASYFSISVPYFCTRFKEYTNMSYKDYLKSKRMKAARELLETSDMKVTDIARVVGYSDEKYFHKVFKSVFCITPNEYREKKA